MEEKLAKYRAEKAVEFSKQRNNEGGILANTWKSITGVRQKTKQDDTKSIISDEAEEEKEPLTFDISRKLNERITIEDKENIPIHIKILKGVLWFILWLIFWHFFIEVGFGAVYFIITASYVMYLNMRSGRSRDPSEPSAYSVFNPNCERIQGTFAAEKPGDLVF